MSVGAIRAGGAAVVITADDQASPALARLGRAAAAARAQVDKVGGGGMSVLEKIATKTAMRFAGIGVALSGVNAGLRSAGDALVSSLADPSKDFWAEFSSGYAEAIRNLPVIGSIAQIAFAPYFAELDKLKAEVDQIAEESERRRAMVAARNEGTADSSRNMRLGALRVEEARLASSSRGMETEWSASQWREISRQKAMIENEEFARAQAERARKEGVSETSVGIGAERFRQLQEETRQRLRDALDIVDIEYEERLARARQERDERRRAGEAEAARLAAERIEAERQVAARVEEIQLDQQDRLVLARLDAEEASLEDETPAARVRRAEIQSQRELVALQQQLDEAESRILAEKGLTDSQRRQAIEAERQIAEIQAAGIRSAVDRARQGEDAAEKVTATTSGTFSAIAAARMNTSNQRVAEASLAALKQIAANTSTTQGFGP